MGKTVRKSEKPKVFEITDRKNATITKFNDSLYCHFADILKKKTVTFTRSEIKELKKNLPDILAAMKEKKDETVKNKKEKISPCVSPYASNSDSDSCDSE